MSALTKETAILCNAAEEWAQTLDITADAMSNQGVEGRRAAGITRQEAQEIRDAIKTFRPLRLQDENDEWIEPGQTLQERFRSTYPDGIGEPA